MFNQNEKIIVNYSKKDLKEVASISLKLPISDKALSNFIHIKNGTALVLSRNPDTILDEEKYLKDVITIINTLKRINKEYTVIIKIDNRELLKESNLIKALPINVNLEIINDDNTYSLTEYLKEERILENMIVRVRGANLSPLEKYLAIYDIVKKYKPYKDNKKNPNESRKLKYILSDNNPYIVCAGFTKLLTELLSRVNISSKYLSVSIDTSYEGGMTVEEKNISFERHARNLIRIDDDKYNIHGYYLADTTWDNNPQYDLFNNCLLTFDRKKEAKRLEKLDDIDLLMDFHNQEEFQTKIRYFLKMGISHPGIDDKTEEDLKKRTYKDLYLKVIDILSCLDREKYIEFYNKYDYILNVNLSETTSSKLEIPMSNFLADYAKYIIPLSNNKIELNTIFRAMTVVKKEVEWMNEAEIKEWLKIAIQNNIENEEKEFPYIYDESYK